jgi:hypothetical protein
MTLMGVCYRIDFVTNQYEAPSNQGGGLIRKYNTIT